MIAHPLCSRCKAIADFAIGDEMPCADCVVFNSVSCGGVESRHAGGQSEARECTLRPYAHGTAQVKNNSVIGAGTTRAISGTPVQEPADDDCSSMKADGRSTRPAGVAPGPQESPPSWIASSDVSAPTASPPTAPAVGAVNSNPTLEPARAVGDGHWPAAADPADPVAVIFKRRSATTFLVAHSSAIQPPSSSSESIPSHQ